MFVGVFEMTFFDMTKAFKTNKDVNDKISELYKANQDVFESESQVIRSAVIKFYNEWKKDIK